MPEVRRVGVVGIGRMGWPMAARLVGAGFDVTVCDSVPGRAEDFVARIGGRAARSPEQAAADADAVITMLPSSGEVRAVVEVMRPSLRAGAVLIEMSSGEPGVTQQIAETLASQGVRLVDAPVSGGVSRAETGDLAIMTGGATAESRRVGPALRGVGVVGEVVGAGGLLAFPLGGGPGFFAPASSGHEPAPSISRDRLFEHRPLEFAQLVDLRSPWRALAP